MLSFGFGKRPKHKKFGYVPRFYDEEKERLEQQVGKYKGDTAEEEKVKQRISSGLRQRYVGDESYRKAHVKKSNLRILYVLIILCIVSYLIITSTSIQTVLESFDGTGGMDEG